MVACVAALKLSVRLLLTDKKAEEASSLSTFYRWQDAQWKA